VGWVYFGSMKLRTALSLVPLGLAVGCLERCASTDTSHGWDESTDHWPEYGSFFLNVTAG